ncbi:hypothetical protein AMELA_G00025310 [Ameiurus melas]|uniref:Uncharacterized protein n=1 Tax=Ameiurus melas TaxID=219545 RepID=A0A7J6BDF3_AMEME|nr:hypothetical protein AMELA_G00025310 [Ameiurus melas]
MVEGFELLWNDQLFLQASKFSDCYRHLQLTSDQCVLLCGMSTPFPCLWMNPVPLPLHKSQDIHTILAQSMLKSTDSER